MGGPGCVRVSDFDCKGAAVGKADVTETCQRDSQASRGERFGTDSSPRGVDRRRSTLASSPPMPSGVGEGERIANGE
jgi:hypothetical protein